MRYIKLYEEFRHDEIHDVMMAICDEVSFKESEVYPSSERVRIYETSGPVDFDPKQYEEYLEGWTIKYVLDDQLEEEMETYVAFIKGDPKEVDLSWLNEIYGKLVPVEEDGRIFYVDSERKPLFYYTENKYFYVNYYRIWSLFCTFFDMKYNEIEDLIKVWLGDTYKLSVNKLKFYGEEEMLLFGLSWERPIN